MAASDAKPFPIKNQAYRVTFPILDADGDLVSGAANLDSEISKDGGAFVDCTNEATEIATSSGMYYLDLTAAEMNADTVAIIVKTTTTDAKTTPIVLYPAEDGDIPVNVTQISGDATAADNLELDYDGTGYNKANSTIGTCTTNTDMRGTDNAALASVVGSLADAAADGDPTSNDTIVQYLKQIVNVLVGTTGIVNFPAEAAPANNVSLAEVIRAIHADVTGLNGDAMRGTDNAALASVVGALNDTPATGDPSNTETAMQYLKQLVNVLVGTTGIATFPASAAPGNGVSLAEVVRAIYDDTNSLDGTKIPDTLSLSNINAEVVDVHNVDTIALPGQSSPPLTPTLREAIGWLYKVLRNKKTQTATAWQLYDDTGTTVDAKASISDDGTTATKEEIVTGP